MPYNGFKASREIRQIASIANTGNAVGGLHKVAEGTLSSGSVAYGSPKFYSPLHTPSNWQVPTKRREIYLWCLTPDSKVLMSNGLEKEIKDLFTDFFVHDAEYQIDSKENIVLKYNKKDIKVITHAGNIKAINSIYRRYVEEDIFCIHTQGFEEPLKITGNHEVFSAMKENVVCKYQLNRKRQSKCAKVIHGDYCHTSNYCFQSNESRLVSKKTKVSDLKVGDYLYEPIRKNVVYHKELKDSAMARFLGYYLAEGHTYENKKRSQYSVAFDFHINELDTYGKEVEECVLELFNKKVNYSINGNKLRIYFQSKEALDFIREYIPGKATTKTLHTNILDMPEEWLLNFIGAYLNGDGCYVKSAEITFKTASYSLAKQLKMLLHKCNITTSKVMCFNSTLNDKNFISYGLSIPMGQCAKLTEFCNRQNFAGFNHTSKSRTFISENKTFGYITKIEKIPYKGFVYCLGVDDDNSFVANGIAVSNCRFFSANEPRVASALDIYSQLPITEFENVCEDESITIYYDDLCRRLKIDEWLTRISHDFFCLGDVFVFANVYCPTCGGSGIVPDSIRKDGSFIQCNHEGGTFHSLTMLNPDWVEVSTTSIIDDEVIFVVPGNDLRNVVQRRSPPDIYNRIPDFIKQAVELGRPIQLHPLCITHLAHNRSGTNPYGRSLITRLFRTLAYKDKIIQAQWIAADRHILPVRIVKVGNDTIPATEQDIQAVQAQLLAMSNDPTITLVTHHAFDYSFEGASGKVMQLGKEYDMIDQEILDGLMINKALLNGEGPNYSSAAVGLEAFIKRLENLRNMLKRFIEERIYRPVAQMQGFTHKNERNEEELIYPKVKFKEMRLRDDTQIKNLMMQLAEKKMISQQTMLEYFGIDFNVEIDRIRMENIVQTEYGIGGGEEGGGGGGGIPDLGGGGGGGMPDLGGGGGGGEMGGGGAEGGSIPESVPEPGGGPEASMPISTSSHGLIGRPTVSRKKQSVNIPKPPKPTPEEVESLEPKKLILNVPEQKIFRALQKAQKTGYIKQIFIPQFKPDDSRRYVLDFAFPRIKLGLEIDGPLHDTPEKIAEDKEKDLYLGKQGWYIHRFKEKEINYNFNDKVYPTLINIINKRTKQFSPPKSNGKK